MAGAREPSMEDILASIKRVIAEEKEIRAAAPPSSPETSGREEDVLELDESMEAVTHRANRSRPAPARRGASPTKAAKSSRRWPPSPPAAPPPPAYNPLEEMIREMLRPILKQWLDEHLPAIVDEHVKREIHRITGRPV